jgi:hypothetical protein
VDCDFGIIFVVPTNGHYVICRDHKIPFQSEFVWNTGSSTKMNIKILSM